LGGDHDSEIAMISHITLSPSLMGIDFPIKMKRRQFPIQLAFAMTINKAQGQSVSHISLNLRTPVFAHGQLYVAFLQATSSECICVLLCDEHAIPTSSTMNVVYKEILIK
jgi:hypothetical protein